MKIVYRTFFHFNKANSISLYKLHLSLLLYSHVYSVFIVMSFHSLDHIFVYLFFFYTLQNAMFKNMRIVLCFQTLSFSPFLSREDRVNKLFFIIVFILALCIVLLLEFYHCCLDVDFFIWNVHKANLIL